MQQRVIVHFCHVGDVINKRSKGTKSREEGGLPLPPLYRPIDPSTMNQITNGRKHLLYCSAILRLVVSAPFCFVAPNLTKVKLSLYLIYDNVLNKRLD